MKDLRRRFDRFCLKNRDKGVPNLMLIIAIGNLIVYVLSLIDPSYVVYSALCFNTSKILRGQLWRLFTYIFTYLTGASGGYLLLYALSLYFYYQLGRVLERYWGRCRFNLYYLTGLLLTDIAALLLGYPATADALNLSLFLAVATLAPDMQVLLLFIPLKMKWLAWVYLAGIAWDILRYILAAPLRLYWLLPLVPLANYFLFFGSDCRNLLPDSLKNRPRRNYRASNPRPNANWANSYRAKSGEKPYRHKCEVCGRTDTDYPDLEFRYCSKCSGYHCYCIDHINNHVHIQ